MRLLVLERPEIERVDAGGREGTGADVGHCYVYGVGGRRSGLHNYIERKRARRLDKHAVRGGKSNGSVVGIRIRSAVGVRLG